MKKNIQEVTFPGKSLSKCYREEDMSIKFYIWTAEKLTMLYTKAHQRFCFTVFMVSLLSSKASSSCIDIKRLTFQYAFHYHNCYESREENNLSS